jgi:diaminopimelate epimerase
VRFAKGHGTRNDFVVLPPGEVDHLDAPLVRALCDRRAGIGADGVLRVVPVDAGDQASPGPGAGEEVRWFMDYRNADGSVAQMCGNGIRVFARYLVASGLEHPGLLRIATRAGVREVEVGPTGDVVVDMGHAEPLPAARVRVGATAYDATGWSLGNPHLVVVGGPDLAAADLSGAPGIDPADSYPDGVNVELVERVAAQHVRMRVHERGVGETQSCGTGACAAAVAVMAADAERGVWRVDVPGGTLHVTWRPDGTVLLCGPAVLVAFGELDESVLGDAPVGDAILGQAVLPEPTPGGLLR